MQLTLIKSKHSIGKEFSLDDEGNLGKKAFGNVSGSISEIISLNNATEFADLLNQADNTQAIVYGVPDAETSVLKTHDELKALLDSGAFHDTNGYPYISRTLEYFKYQSSPGICMLDIDAPPNGPCHNKDDLLNILYDIIPALKSHPHIWAASSSSYIENAETGKQVTGLNGQRIYIPVEDASDIPRFGKVLFDRLWLSGHGHIKISSSGKFLVRSIVDASVWQPNHLDFIGGAICTPPLVQKRPNAEVFNA